MSSYHKQSIALAILIGAITFALPLMVSGAVINNPAGSQSKLPKIGETSAPNVEEGNIARLFQYIYVIGLATAGIMAVGGLIYAGVLYLTAGGSATKVGKAKDRIYGALYGLGLLLASYLILYTINPALVSLSNPRIKTITLRPSFWNLETSYGALDANVPLGMPCLTDYDCAYDLACCPANNTECEQNLGKAGDPAEKKQGNKQANKTLWFECGWQDPQWYSSTGDVGACPKPAQPGKLCSKLNDAEKTQNTPCCEDKDKPAVTTGISILCCQKPDLVSAANKKECNYNYGASSNTYEDPETGETLAGEGRCNECSEPVATCQKLKAPDETVRDVSWLVLTKDRRVNDVYGEKCFHEDYKATLGLAQKQKNTCQDERLICHHSKNICMEPGVVGDECEKKSDCCRKANFDIPQCQKYTRRDISLSCEAEECSLSEKEEEELAETENPKPDNYECQMELTGGKSCAASVVDDIDPNNNDFTIVANFDAWCGEAGERLIKDQRAAGTDAKCCCQKTAQGEVRVTMVRTDENNERTFGKMTITNGQETLKLDTLELPYKNNDRNISRVNAGTYSAYLKDTSKGWRIELKNVPGRDGIQIHKGINTADTKGCIVVSRNGTKSDNELKFDADIETKIKEIVDAVNATDDISVSITCESDVSCT